MKEEAKAPEAKKPEGWAYPPGAAKTHYFRNRRSLCRAWTFFGAVTQELGDPADNCLSCTTRLARRRPTTTEGAT